MRLLIISYAFPPFNSIGGLRVGKTAKYLAEHGHDVRVLTTEAQPYPPTLPLEIAREKVIYSRWMRIGKSAENILKEGGGAHAGGGASDGGVAYMLKNELDRFAKALLHFPDAFVGWVPFAMKEAARLLEGWRPEVILASSPPPTSLLVAHKVARKYRIPWVADLRDPWVDHHYYNQPRWRKYFEEKLERRILSSAAGLVTVSPPWAEALEAKHGKFAAVVPNGFDPADYPARAEVPHRDGWIEIVYTGLVYQGRQDPSPLFKALRELGPAAGKVRVVFYGALSYDVRGAAALYGVEHLVEAAAPVPYREALSIQTSADALLLLLWNDPKERGVFPAKMFEYVGAGRPILAVGGTGSAAAEFLREKRLGLVTDDPGRIAAQLREWVEQKQQAGSIPGPAEETVAGVSREERTRELEAYLSEVIRANATGAGAQSA
jgi:glycosyltransferase involved in cell wall biosynthesis